MTTSTRFAVPVSLAVITLVLATCTATQPTPSQPAPSGSVAPAPTVAATPTATTVPEPTPEPEVEMPLAVVTGYTATRSAITLADLELVDAIQVPCGVTEYLGIDARTHGGDCLTTELITDRLAVEPDLIALFPPALVTPKVKVLPVDGADLFGGPDVRALPYPVMGKVIDMEPYDPEQIRTLISLGDSCPDRGVAYAALIQGQGWEWVFGGGTAEYTRVYPNPVPPGVPGNGFNIVDAVRTGNEGEVAELVSGADVTLDDFECPVVDDFSVAVDDSVVFSIDPTVLPLLHDTYGVDVATLAANHLFDRGTSGFLETLEQFVAADILTTGAGENIEAALEPAFFDANGLTFGFVAFNEIPPEFAEAGPANPGVLWLRDANVIEAVSRAHAHADVVICVPQWWGGGEYHAEFRGDMRRQQQVFFDAGCNHILGHGTHWSGPIEIGAADDGNHRVTMVSHGNFLFGQGWSQETQEGVIVELSFRGAQLAQARMHPYIMLEQAQTNLTDPETDGLGILRRIYAAADAAQVGTTP